MGSGGDLIGVLLVQVSGGEDCKKEVKDRNTLDRVDLRIKRIERNRFLDPNTGDLFVRGISLCAEDAN